MYCITLRYVHNAFVDAWIVTGGTNTGVMEIVGDAVHDYMLQMGVSGRRIVVLGIATWGFVANKASLVVNEVRTLLFANCNFQR